MNIVPPLIVAACVLSTLTIVLWFASLTPGWLAGCGFVALVSVWVWLWHAVRNDVDFF